MKTFIILYIASILCITTSCKNVYKNKNKLQSFESLKKFPNSFQFMMVSDWGRNGFCNQQEVANAMAKQADSIYPHFIISCGDNFQYDGVASIQDPLWLTTFENVFNKPSLLVNWFLVLGNHDYRGNTQAEIDYSKISRRWNLPARYYSFVEKINDSISARFIFIDTTPLVEEYYTRSGFPDVAQQDSAKQMQWLENELATSKEQWKLVFGHHPIFSACAYKTVSRELLQRVKPMLEKYHAQIYFCGHNHDLQHLRQKNGGIDYVINGAGSETRPFGKNEMSLYSNSVPAFSIVTFHADSIRVCFVDTVGKALYNFERSYR